MKRILPVTITVLVLVSTGWASLASAFERRNQCPCSTPWQTGYYDPAWGMPVALVVPPTAEYQTNWGWGVGNTRVTPIWPQFQRDYPGPLQYDPRTLRPIPAWPSDTNQMGVYYIRGPW